MPLQDRRGRRSKSSCWRASLACFLVVPPEARHALLSPLHGAVLPWVCPARVAAAPVEDVLLQDRDEGLHGSVVAGGGDAEHVTGLSSSPRQELSRSVAPTKVRRMIVLAKRSTLMRARQGPPTATTFGADWIVPPRISRTAGNRCVGEVFEGILELFLEPDAEADESERVVLDGGHLREGVCVRFSVGELYEPVGVENPSYGRFAFCGRLRAEDAMYSRIDPRPDASPEESSRKRRMWRFCNWSPPSPRTIRGSAIVRFTLLAVISLATVGATVALIVGAASDSTWTSIASAGAVVGTLGIVGLMNPLQTIERRHRHSPVVRCDRRWLGEQRRRGLDATHHDRFATDQFGTLAARHRDDERDDQGLSCTRRACCDPMTVQLTRSSRKRWQSTRSRIRARRRVSS